MWVVVRSANCRLELNYGMQHEVGASVYPRQELGRRALPAHQCDRRLSESVSYGLCADLCTDMVPLMMQRGYKPKGWLGLILGTKLYYEFFAAAVDTDDKFMKQVNALTREIGDRGKVKRKPAVHVSEGVPPAPAPAPATPPRSAALAPIGSPAEQSEQAFSPSMQMTMPTQGMTAVDTSGMVERLLEQQREMFREQREEIKADRAEPEAKMEARLQQQRAELTAPAPAAISEEQVAALQARLEGLHTAKLLTDEVRAV